MASAEDQHAAPDFPAHGDDASIISTRGLESFGRKVTTTASQLMGPLGDPTTNPGYQNAMSEVGRQLRRPGLHRNVFSMARTTPTDLVRSRLSTKEIQSRALSRLPEEMLQDMPADTSTYSLFQGFRATFPDLTDECRKHSRRLSRGRRLMDDKPLHSDSPHAVQKLKAKKSSMMHELEILNIRKNMASSEIREIDSRMANLTGMRAILVDRIADLEQEETVLEHEVVDVEERLEEAQDLVDEAETIAERTPVKTDSDTGKGGEEEDVAGFMSQSVYEKLPWPNSSPPKSRKKTMRKRSMPILQEHFHPGTMIRAVRAHQDSITALDFDFPFGSMVTAAMDDTVRVWDLNTGRCMGFLEGHTASVRTLQVEDNICATGGMDATIRLWDLSNAHYYPQGSKAEDAPAPGNKADDKADDKADHEPDNKPAGSMGSSSAFLVLEAHVDEITALHFRGDVLVSGSADKTLRHWDLQKGRCVQTLDVMWAAAQASALTVGDSAAWRQTSRSADGAADFVGAVQVFDTALACGTADGMVRLWDLRSGQVHRSLVGHTGPVTCLQFDDMHLVTGSLDRSVRIWDLRTGAIYDAYAYDNPITSMNFDSRRIVCAAGEAIVKVYDKVECRQWDCGPGIADLDADDAKTPAAIEKVRIKDGYLLEGRRDGVVGAWAC